MFFSKFRVRLARLAAEGADSRARADERGDFRGRVADEVRARRREFRARAVAVGDAERAHAVAPGGEDVVLAVADHQGRGRVEPLGREEVRENVRFVVEAAVGRGAVEPGEKLREAE